jgi:hypothetical protein
MGYGFTALNSARLTPMNHKKDGIHFVWKTNRAASVICKNVAMKKPFTFSMAEAEIQPVRESHWHDFILWENAP